MKIINYVIALMFPFILNQGYATTSGIYMLLPIEERQKKTRHILRLSGGQIIPYWLGLFLADYILFLIPTTLFGLIVGMSGLQVFSDHLFQFIGGMLGFGIAIIAMTYLLASFFSSQDGAIKCNIFFQLIVGTFLPFIVMGVAGGFSKSLQITKYCLTFFYFFNPMFTFYLTNYLIVLEFINQFIPDAGVSLVIPLSFNLQVSMKLSLVAFFTQWFVYLSLTMLRDHFMNNAFRSKSKNSVKIMQP